MLEQLDWLLPAPADFGRQVKALRLSAASGGRDAEDTLIALATRALDLDQLDRLAKAADALASEASPPRALARAKLGIVGAGTLTLAASAIKGTAPRHRVLVDTVMGDFGLAVQEALDPTSALHAAGLDFILIAPDHRMLGLERACSSEAEAAAKVDAAVALLRTVVDGFRASAPGGVLVQTVVPPIEPLFGSFDAVEPGSIFSMVAAVNAAIVRWAAARDVVCVDVARVANWVGLDRWHDPVRWHTAKLPMALGVVPIYADLVARTVAALRGKVRKCLVLDLDNTLWGGVIGDDGLEGIRLGQGSSTGEAFLAIQNIALELRGRGIVLAVCSKNEEDAARLPFRSHPEMILREDHIAVFQANWTDKASNLRAIAETLNIGLDALVFLDDNPAEREQIRRELPMVAVPELPDDPAYYPRALACAGYFEAVSIVEEDRKRADDYQANVARRALASSSDVAGYLASLDMVCTLAPFDAVGRSRISQLINKSNQYNLTTRRYTESQVEAIERDPSKFTLQVRLTDRFGDNGMISVVVFDRQGATWDADTWLMSCRVLGRRVQEAVLAAVVRAAVHEGARALTGRYIASEKNKMVADHYAKLGFALVEETAEGSLWRLDLSTYREPDLPMRRVGPLDPMQAVA